MVVQRIRSLGLVRAAALLGRAAPGLTVVLLAVMVCGAAASVLTMVTAGLAVGAVPGAVHDGLASPAGHHLLLLLLMFGVVSVGSAVLAVAQSGLATALKYRAGTLVDARLIAVSLSPCGISHLEEPRYADRLRRATADEWPAEMLAEWLPAVIAPRLQAVGLAVVLVRFSWWAPLVLVASAVVTYRYYLRFADSVYRSVAESTDVIRRAGYFRDLLTGPEAAKEVRLFGLRGWLIEQMSVIWNRGMTIVWQRRRSAQRGVYGTVLVIAIAVTLVLIELVLGYSHGRFSLAAFTVFVQAAVALPMLGWVGDADYLTRNAISALTALDELGGSGAEATSVEGGGGTVPDGQLRGEIAFESVEFGYPGTDNKVLRRLSLRIPAGKSVAIVGVNGAGKTTLIKLLTRLYDPDGGRIAVDGTNLRELNPEAWRARVAVVFQDFVRYPLSLRANVGYGDLGRITDRVSLSQALAAAGASYLPGRLSSGWDTVLSRQFDGGSDLSGGEWQKVALARAMLASQRAAVLVLDEPTANMDVRAEAALFERFMDLTRGLTTVLISHRLGGVRKADLIYVIDSGTVVETGSHDELMARNGRYAHMFRLQAARFADTGQKQRANANGTAPPDPVATVPAADPPSGAEVPPAVLSGEPRRRSLIGSAAALGTVLRGCLREPRGLVARSLLLVPVTSAVGALQALWMRQMIDGASRHLLVTALTGALLLVISVIAWRFIELMGATDRITLSERIGFAFDRMVAVLTAAIPGLEQHESSAFLDHLHLLRSRMLGMGRLLNWLLNLLQDLGGFVVTAVLLATVIPWLLLLMPVGLGVLWLQSISQRVAARAQEASAPGYRLAEQLRDLATSPSAAKELRVYRLGAEISGRHREARRQADDFMLRAQWPIAAAECAGAVVSTLSMITAVIVAAVMAADRQVPLSAVLLVFLLAVRFLGHVGGLVQATQIIAAQLQTAERFRWLNDYASRLRPRKSALPVPHAPSAGLTLDRVSFRYPGTTQMILRDVSLRLPAGAVVALVGENGAGKTTLVKLLCRLYEPSAGTILVGDTRLGELDPDQWRRRLSAAFQDFTRFELLAGQTVGVGDVPRLADLAGAQRALELAGGGELASTLPQGLDTQLGRRWVGGVDLSSGQWQKLALARALMRAAPILLMLDEPTASLDAEAEHALFERFSDATRHGIRRGTITLLVSHRFSTVRMADIIVVLHRGVIAEVGSHAELLARGGRYAGMYNMQALAYQ